MQLVTKQKRMIKTWTSFLFNPDRSQTKAILTESMRMGISSSAWNQDHTAEATAFAQFCWNGAWARTHQSSGQSSANSGRLESHSSLRQTHWMWILSKSGMTQVNQASYAPAAWWCWPQAAGCGDTSGPTGDQRLGPLKFYIHLGSHRAQENWAAQKAVKQVKCRQAREPECFGNNSKYFQNTLKPHNYTKWNAKYWLPGLDQTLKLIWETSPVLSDTTQHLLMLS